MAARGGGAGGVAQASPRPSGGASRGQAPGKLESPKLPQPFSPGATRAVGAGCCYEQSPPCLDCFGESGANHRGSPAWVF